MKSTKKKKVAQQPEVFPGYPHYAPEDDIMNRAERIETNLENEFISSNTKPTAKQDNLELQEGEDDSKPIDEFSVTQEDLEALGPKDLSMDMGDDEQLKHRTTPIDFSANDLDIPGSELDDNAESIGL